MSSGDAIDRVQRLQNVAAHQKQKLRNNLIQHRLYIEEKGDDMPEIKDWKWPG